MNNSMIRIMPSVIAFQRFLNCAI